MSKRSADAGGYESPRSGRIHQVLESAAPWSRPIRELLCSYPHNRNELDALGLTATDLSVLLGRSLPEPGGLLLVAEDHERMTGLVDLHPDLWPSAMLGHRMWTVRHLILDPAAPDSLPSLLVERACELVESQVDFLAARPPASDAAAIRGLKSTGFRVVGGEVVGVIRELDVPVPQLSSMTFGLLEPGQLQAATELAGACSRCVSWAIDPDFERERLLDMLRQRMSGCNRDEPCGTMAAMNRQGKLLGILGFSLDTRLESYLGRRLARLDFVGVAPRHRGAGISTLLLQHTLVHLARQGIEAAAARVVMHGTGPTNELAALHKLGFTIAGTNLIMHRWMQPEDRTRPRPGDDRTAHPASI